MECPSLKKGRWEAARGQGCHTQQCPSGRGVGPPILGFKDDLANIPEKEITLP